MIDAPGPGGTGPFLLAEGTSNIRHERVIVSQDPLSSTWLWSGDRTPRFRLVANPGYWDGKRGPHLRQIVFCNDLSPERALELVCTTEGEVDLVTEVDPVNAERVERSEHAKLVTIDALRTVVGILDRDAEGLPLQDQRARQALNLAVDRAALIARRPSGTPSRWPGSHPGRR